MQKEVAAELGIDESYVVHAYHYLFFNTSSNGVPPPEQSIEAFRAAAKAALMARVKAEAGAPDTDEEEEEVEGEGPKQKKARQQKAAATKKRRDRRIIIIIGGAGEDEEAAARQRREVGRRVIERFLRRTARACMKKAQGACAESSKLC